MPAREKTTMSMIQATTESGNVFVGRNAGFATTGAYNSIIGTDALLCNTTGYYNTANGHYALGKQTTGIRNSAIGFYAGCAITTGNYNTVLGSFYATGFETLSNRVYISDGNNNLRIYVDNNGNVHSDADVIAYSTTISDKRLKDNVETITDASTKIANLRGVEYVWNKGSRKGEKDMGLIAQEVEEVIPHIVREKEMAFFGLETYKTIDYEKIVALLIEGFKEQQAQIEELKQEIKKLKE